MSISVHAEATFKWNPDGEFKGAIAKRVIGTDIKDIRSKGRKPDSVRMVLNINNKNDAMMIGQWIAWSLSEELSK